MNAVEHLTTRLPPEAVRRLAAMRVGRFDSPGLLGTIAARPRVLDNDQAIEHVIARWGDDLCGLLNALTRGELAALATALRVDVAAGARSWELRAKLWDAGAALERGGVDVGRGVQPAPVVLGGHLVVQAAPRGLFPPSEVYPRHVPAPADPRPPVDEPETVDDLLAAADAAIGVRLGARGRDKGAWGMRAQALLGVRETGDEPDWQGDVEIKTVPIALDPSGLWRVVEDPAIAMVGEGVIAKLQRTLWLARATISRRDGDEGAGDSDDATIVSWYLLDWDADIARLARRYLHDRPKGPAGTLARGKYLGKRFFAECGLLATLNGQL
ncbi:MAG: hypothetical protein H0V17_01530 [Deltaproteobacteria bacterium]|nr:hypothetical protein [Deltaproteobacteria bacterium]